MLRPGSCGAFECERPVLVESKVRTRAHFQVGLQAFPSAIRMQNDLHSVHSLGVQQGRRRATGLSSRSQNVRKNARNAEPARSLLAPLSS